MRLFRWILSSLFILGIIGCVGGFLMLRYFTRDLPDYRQLADYAPPIVTRLHASNGVLMAEYATEHRVFVPLEAMPPHLVQAFVSAEDQNFYRHNGIDFRGVARAVLQNLQNLQSDRRLVGASTITQQVAKNFLLSNEVSFERKVREALLALRIERAFSKEEILELYLNEIYLGRSSYGVAAAALTYFNKSLPELSLAEAAFLAGLPKAPNNYNPVTNHPAAVERRNYVLDRMLEDHIIGMEQANAAKAAPLEIENRGASEYVRADYFAEEVRRELQALYGDDALYEGGLSVRTSLNPELQELADRVLQQGLIKYDRERGYRGPVATLEGFDNWPAQLKAVPRPPGSGRWQLAVVLEVLGDSVRIGLADRTQGTVPLEELTWARHLDEQRRLGPAVRRAEDALALGDVVLVEPVGPPVAAPPPEAEPEAELIEVAATAEPTEAPDRPLRAYGLRQIPEVQGAIVVMDPHTGRVLAVTGGYSYEISEFNRATQALRQPGSAFKPFVYLAALSAGYTPSTIVLDTPLEIDLGAGMAAYRPANYGNDYLGPMPLRVGLERSRNIMTVRLLLEIGLEPVRDVVRRFGVMDDMPLMFSMGLGAGETTPLRLTTAYAMLANGGRRLTASFIDRIQDRHGETIYRHDDSRCAECEEVAWDGQSTPVMVNDAEQISDPLATYQLISMMEGVVQRGTATALKSLGIPLAGKTGTTNDSRDAWFVGFTPDLVAGVYVGYDTPTPLGPRETGGSIAVPIFGAFVDEALDGIEVPPFRVPEGATMVRVDPRTGLLASDGSWEIFRPGTEPQLPTVTFPVGANGQPLAYDPATGAPLGYAAIPDPGAPAGYAAMPGSGAPAAYVAPAAAPTIYADPLPSVTSGTGGLY